VFGVDEAALSERAAGFAEEAAFLEAFGEAPGERAGEGEVCCRECGRPTGSLAAHAGAAHGVSVSEYEKSHPSAPLGSERRVLVRSSGGAWTAEGQGGV
jgi:hypothetical protein